MAWLPLDLDEEHPGVKEGDDEGEKGARGQPGQSAA